MATGSINVSSDGAISAMTKLSESLVRNQEAALKASEEKADNRLKAWKKLPKIQQDIILLGGLKNVGQYRKSRRTKCSQSSAVLTEHKSSNS